MANDKKRKRGEEISYKNRPKIPPRTQIIFFCEGDTEKLYFPSFKRYKNAKNHYNIEIGNQDVKHNDAEGLVRDAIKYLKENNINKYLGDIAYCVFDSDPLSNPDKKLKTAIDIARRFKSQPIEILFSNPCIEVWYYMHYDNPPVVKCADDMKKKLKLKITNYTEKTDVYNVLYQNMEAAINRARILHNNQTKNYDNVISHECNPYSNIFRFIEYLDKLISDKDKNQTYEHNDV